MKIVFAWELGANYGHLVRGLSLAECLRKLGHDVWFAVRDLRTADEVLTPLGFPFVPCPFLARPLPLTRAPINYSHILAEQGYVDRSILHSLVRAWTHLWRAMQPQVVVVDHAPTALLSAHALSIPTALFSSPFSVPPAVSPLPSIRPWESISIPDLLQIDERVLATVNTVLTSFSRRPLDRFADLFAGLPTMLTTFPELDCYGLRDTASYLGPITGESSHPRVRWDARSDSKRVFAYLRPSIAGLESLLNALRRSPIQLICVMPGAPDSMIARLQRDGLDVRTSPVDLSVLLPEADLVVSYGSAGIIAQALINAVPLLLIPHALEQHLNSIRAADLGTGIIIDTARTQDRFSDALGRLLGQPNYAMAASVFADKYAGFSSVSMAEQAARAIVEVGHSS